MRHMEGVATAWDALAKSWTAMQGEVGDGNQQWIINPALFALAGEVRGQRVLDAACGGGHIARELAQRGAGVTAIDISPRMIEIAKAHPESQALRVQYVVGSVTEMPEFADGSFDLVVSSMALMNVPEVERAFAEFARVLRGGGRLVFSLPHPCYPRREGSRGVSHEGGDGEWYLDYYQVSDYLNEATEPVPLPDENDELHPVPTIHRTLTSYVGTMVRSGFVLDGLIEPQPPDTSEAKAELGMGWWEANRRIPYYLVVRARKL